MRVSLSIYPGKKISIVKQAQLVVVQLSIINIKSKTKKQQKILTERWRVNLADYLRVVAYT
jgi:hypothetical protein